jgi:hypothetical protein
MTSEIEFAPVKGDKFLQKAVRCGERVAAHDWVAIDLRWRA